MSTRLLNVKTDKIPPKKTRKYGTTTLKSIQLAFSCFWLLTIFLTALTYTTDKMSCQPDF